MRPSFRAAGRNGLSHGAPDRVGGGVTPASYPIWCLGRELNPHSRKDRGILSRKKA